MNFLPSDDGSDYDNRSSNSSVIDISDFLNDVVVEAATGNINNELSSVVDHNNNEGTGNNNAPTNADPHAIQGDPSNAAPPTVDPPSKVSARSSTTTTITLNSTEIRILMGNSILQWRKSQRQQDKRKSLAIRGDDDKNDSLLQHQDQQYLLWCHRITPGSLSTIKWSDSVEVEVSDNDTVRLIDSSRNKNSSVGGDTVALPKVLYHAKSVQMGPQVEATTTTTSPAMMDVVAVWDPQAQVYRLEIPALIATDLLVPSSPTTTTLADTSATRSLLAGEVNATMAHNKHGSVAASTSSMNRPRKRTKATSRKTPKTS